ncbi:MAG: hypothetical protein UH083_02225, partial [Ruminococcus sp.]|nr:hypothetical protein [Ruminococcus sp.]
MKGNSDITAKAFSDAALICVDLTMSLSKAAEIAHRRPLPRWAARLWIVGWLGNVQQRRVRSRLEFTISMVG